MSMEKVKSFFSTISVFGLLCVLGWIIYKFIIFAAYTFSLLDKTIAVAIIVGSTTIVASALTIALGRYYQAKEDRIAVHRDKKIELYDELLKKLFDIFANSGTVKLDSNNDNAITEQIQITPNDDLVQFLREVQRKIILWSGPDVIKAYSEWHKALIEDSTKFEVFVKQVKFYLALRNDLGHSNKGIDHSHIINILLSNSDLAMSEYKKNPNITFEELALMEKELIN